MASRRKGSRAAAAAPVKKEPVPAKTDRAIRRHVVQEDRPQRSWCGVLRRDDGGDHQIVAVQAPSFFDAQEKAQSALAERTDSAVTHDNLYVFPVAADIASKLPKG